ncbi:hypothetical protein Daus18300_009983 [Diaporthe australafricana]|uniref:Uncharacterized protein n=1 Tax=Diaporthe australafricana TaxID=127596 RepID=A0ABR3WCA4_9PEZI
MSTPTTPSSAPSTAGLPPTDATEITAAAQAAPVHQPPHPPPGAAVPPHAPAHTHSQSHLLPPQDSVPVQRSRSTQQPQLKELGPLPPLPRGRPPRPKAAIALQPPAPGVWQVQPWFDHEASANDARRHDAEATVQPHQQKTPPPLEPAYARGGHLLGGFNSARYAGVNLGHPKFSPEGKLFLLTGSNALDSWIQQVSYIAQGLSCFHEMTENFTTFPRASTVQLFICETRFATAWRILEGSISAQVWAYMRVLGFSSAQGSGQGLMSPTPADCFEYAKQAAARMLIPGTREQPVVERKRMVQEVLMAQPSDYPSERAYKKGVQWLRLACDSLIKQGDFDLAISLYDPVPDWAPRPCDESVNDMATAASPGSEALGTDVPGASSEAVTDAVSSANEPPDVDQPRSLSKLQPWNPNPKKRKRTQRDQGDMATRPQADVDTEN